MRNLPSLFRTLPLVLLVLCTAVLASQTALADHAMPDVSGQREVDAVRTLEDLGLDVHVVMVAGVSPGRVISQDPAAGARVEEGDEVELRVGITVPIVTKAPRVIGMTERRAVEGLADAYDLEVEYVGGARRLQGRVIAQDPQAGQEALYRGRFVIRVVRTQVRVPTLVGLTREKAEAALEDAGLEAELSFRRNQFAPRGTVIGQNPRPGAQLGAGGVVEVTVSGRRGEGQTRRVRVPDVAGLSMHEAEEEIFAAGLTPHVHLVAARSGAQVWNVVAQEVPAGRRVAEGSHVGIDVVSPVGGSAGKVLLPALHGQELDHAADLLQHLGLKLRAVPQASGLPAGTILRQVPRPGAFVPRGVTLTLHVAEKPRPGWNPARVRVPNLAGLTASQARHALYQQGLLPRMARDAGPGATLGQVFRQEPEAGRRVTEGSTVTYVMPLRASVPNVVGLTREQGLIALQEAGLQGIAERIGPAVFGGVSKVFWQAERPGGTIARGSLVRIRFRMVSVLQPLRAVPNVVGMTRADAFARLEGQGFKHASVIASAGVGVVRVVSQSPRAGTKRPGGHVVTVTLRHVTPSLPPTVTVPRVVGRTRNAARATLESLGFVVRSNRVGPVVSGTTVVVAQSPLGSTARARGSVVTITYRYQAVGAHIVPVPNVVGQRVDRALRALRDAGLSVHVTGLGARVRSQVPAAGSIVAPGTRIRISLR